MTGTEYRKTHGDPTKWTDDEYTRFAECATPGGQPVPDQVLAFLKQPPPPRTTATDYQPAA